MTVDNPVQSLGSVISTRDLQSRAKNVSRKSEETKRDAMGRNGSERTVVEGRGAAAQGTARRAASAWGLAADEMQPRARPRVAR